MKKRNVILVLGLIVVVSGGWLWIQGAHAGPQNGVLDVWVAWADGPELDALFERYSQASGVPVRLRAGVTGDQLARGLSGETPPDLVVLSSADRVRSLQAQGLVEPLGSWADAGGVELEDFFAASLAPCVAPDGALLCLPWTCETDALFWNKGLFRAAGLDPERPPQTMEELAEMAARFAVVDGEGRLSRVGFIPDLARSQSEWYARMLGGSWADDEGTELWVDSPAAIGTSWLVPNRSRLWRSIFSGSRPPRSSSKYAIELQALKNHTRYFSGSQLAFMASRSFRLPIT